MQLSDELIKYLKENNWTLTQRYYHTTNNKFIERNCLKDGINSTYVDDDSSEFRIEKKSLMEHKFQMTELKGCCGVAVSFHEETNFMKRNAGIATKAETVRQLIAKSLGYSTLICTITEQNEINQKVKKSAGYNKLYQFNNSRTGNEVIFGIYDLNGSGIICKSDWNMCETIHVSVNSRRYNQVKKAYLEDFIKERNESLTWFQKLILKWMKIK